MPVTGKVTVGGQVFNLSAPLTLPPPVTPGFPDATNTGVPAGTVLRNIVVGNSGPGWSAETVGGNPVFYVRTAGTLIDAFNIPFSVKVMANNVTFKRTRIAASGYYTINVSDPPTYYNGLTLTDCEIDGLNGTGVPGIAVMAGSNATYTRCNFHGFGSSGPRMAGGCTLQDSWIHGFVCVVPEHSAGSSANGGGTNIRWLHNNIDMIPIVGPNSCASNCISIYSDFAPASAYDGVQMIGNRIRGGAYGIYTLQNQGAKNVRVENNVFVRGSFAFGPAAQVQSGSNGNTFSGNTYEDGAPIN